MLNGFVGVASTVISDTRALSLIPRIGAPQNSPAQLSSFFQFAYFHCVRLISRPVSRR